MRGYSHPRARSSRVVGVHAQQRLVDLLRTMANLSGTLWHARVDGKIARTRRSRGRVRFVLLATTSLPKPVPRLEAESELESDPLLEWSGSTAHYASFYSFCRSQNGICPQGYHI